MPERLVNLLTCCAHTAVRQMEGLVCRASELFINARPNLSIYLATHADE